MFWVHLDNEGLFLGYVSGKIRHNFIRILPADRVKVVFNLNIFRGNTIRNSKFQETYFLPIS
nr:translation initiation factor 1 [Androsace erecta]